MKRLVKLIFSLFFIVVLIGIAFLGVMFWKVMSFKKDFENLKNYDYEVVYHIRGDSDVLDMAQYNTEETPVVTRWLSTYIQKMEKGGAVKGHVVDDVFYGNVYAEGETTPSIEFYYDEDAVFGMKKTMDYIIDTVEAETDVSLNVLKEITPDGYVTLTQIQTLMGVNDQGTQKPMDMIQEGKQLLNALKWVIPASGADNYFENQLSDVKMTYCSPIVSVEGMKGAKITFGISNDDANKYIYVRMNDVNGHEGSDLEVLLHIQPANNESIQVPEPISDDIIEGIKTVIALVNSFVQ